MSLLRFDDFNRADTTNNIGNPSDGGSAWQQLSGTWGISGNAGYKSTGGVGGADEVTCLEAGTPNVSIEAIFTVAGNGDSQIAFRIVDAANFLFWVMQTSSGGGIYKYEAGVGTQLYSFASENLLPGITYTLRVDVGSDNNIRCYQDGVIKGSGVSTFNALATKHGLDFFDLDNARVDSITISSYSIDVPSRVVSFRRLHGFVKA